MAAVTNSFYSEMRIFCAKNSITPRKIGISALAFGAIGGLAALGIPPFSHIGGFKSGCVLIGMGGVAGTFAYTISNQPPVVEFAELGRPDFKPYKNNPSVIMECLSAYGSRITHCDLSSVLNTWSTEDVQTLLKALPGSCPNLEYLSLSGRGEMTSEEAFTLRDSLQKMLNLKILDLQECDIKHAGLGCIQRLAEGREPKVEVNVRQLDES